MKCKYCLNKAKTWDKKNSPIQCAFEKGVFSENNWNCGTMVFLREIAEKNYLWNDDLYAGLMPYEGGFVYLEWYKNRGKTDKCIDMQNIQDLTLQEAYNIINYLGYN